LNGAKRLNGLNDLNGPRCRHWLELLGESGFFPEEILYPLSSHVHGFLSFILLPLSFLHPEPKTLSSTKWVGR